MVYTNHDRLAIIQLEKEQETISFDVLKAFLRKKPANVIYVELGGYLYGLFSMGSIRRAVADGKSEIRIRRNFTKIKPGEYMRALQIFRDKDTINAIPVVTSNGVLLGEYSRWDDSIILAWQDPFCSPMLCHKYEKEFWMDKSLLMVKPCAGFDWKERQFRRWKEYFEHLGAVVTVIEWAEAFSSFIDNDNKEYMALFVDRDELSVINPFVVTLDIWGCTFSQYVKEFTPTKEMIVERDIINKFFGFLKDKGIYVLNLTFNSQNTSYYTELSRGIEEKFNVIGREKINLLNSELFQGFFAELYTPEYAKAISTLKFETILTDEAYKLKDIQSPFLNVENNERKTVGQPKEFSQEIFFTGPCFVYGAYVEDKHTMESFLQEKINDLNLSVRVRNLGAPGEAISSYLHRIGEVNLHKNDIVVTYVNGKNIEGVPELNLMDVLEKNEVPADWLVDVVQHANHRVLELYAEAIYEKIKDHFAKENETKIEREIVRADSSVLVQIYLKRIFSDFDRNAYGKIGAIVMNCNPFTKGHRYLIEQALTQVDFLIIFVVEEDKSLFPFDMRFAFVNAGVADLKNVMVVPSGSFILSQTTFPEYFIKIKDEDIIRNVEHDITLFAEQIAPYLNITKRFVGEEPEDGVTREYNEAMKRILPVNGIDLIEIPRLKLEDGKIVSATAVRQCLENNDMEMLDCLVPESTKRILFWENI